MSKRLLIVAIALGVGIAAFFILPADPEGERAERIYSDLVAGAQGSLGRELTDSEKKSFAEQAREKAKSSR